MKKLSIFETKKTIDEYIEQVVNQLEKYGNADLDYVKNIISHDDTIDYIVMCNNKSKFQQLGYNGDFDRVIDPLATIRKMNKERKRNGMTDQERFYKYQNEYLEIFDDACDAYAEMYSRFYESKQSDLISDAAFKVGNLPISKDEQKLVYTGVSEQIQIIKKKIEQKVSNMIDQAKNIAKDKIKLLYSI